MPGTYENFGISFLYPDNWKITDEQGSRPPFEVALQSPGGGLWMLSVFPNLQHSSELIDEVLRTMQSEYEEVEFEPIEETFEGAEVQGYEMNFHFLDFVVTAKVHCFSDGQRTFLVHSQAESKEFAESEPVFRAMMVSLLRPANVGDE